MKWLASTVLCLLTMTASAEPQIARLPSALYCGPYEADMSNLKEQYGEIPFVQGDGEVLTLDPTMSYQGKVRMFLDPEDYSYSIFLDINEELTCLIVTGEKIVPVISGNNI